MEQNTYTNCPICNFPLTSESAICPRCGNDILEDITTLDEQSQEMHHRNTEGKKAEWYTRCITDKLGSCRTAPEQPEEWCSNHSPESRQLNSSPENIAFLQQCRKTDLVEGVALRKKWWNCLGGEWKAVVKNTLKITREPNETDLLNFFKTTSLRCDNRRVHDLLPVRMLDELQQLRCDESPIADLEPLKDLTNLQRLYAFDCNISSLEPLRALKRLKLLWISSTPITSLDPIQELACLEELYCSETAVADLGPLKSLLTLEKLSFYKTAINSLEPIGELENLIELGINDTAVNDLSPLESLSNLEYLRCSKTDIESLESLRNMKMLRELHIARTLVSDLEPLGDLQDLEELDISFIPVRSIEPLMHLDLEKLELSAESVPETEIIRFIELHPKTEVIVKN